MKRNVVLIIIILFLLSLVVHFYPVFKKGYSFDSFGGNLILARNFALTDQFKIESEKNIYLSSERIEQEGIYCDWGNKLTPYIYGWVFKVLGFNQNLPLYFALILWSLSGVILFLVVLRLFNLKVALIFGLIDIFTPVFAQGSLMAGFYEWAVLFFSLGLLTYLWPKKEKEGKNSWLSLLLTSLFFGLASLARNVFLLSFIPFAIYDFWQNKSYKRLLVFAMPFIIIWGIYLVPGYLVGSPNAYLSPQDTSFNYYGHLFPDPYTYHFEKEEHLESVLGDYDVYFSEYLLKYDYPVSFTDRLRLYLESALFYPKEISRITVLGGPLILLLLMAGLIYLYREKRYLFKLFVLWGIVWYFLLIVLKTNNWDHFMELRLPIALSISLGVVWLTDHIMGLSFSKNIKYLVIAVFLLFLIFHFGLSNKWMLHEEYGTSKADVIRELAQVINREQLDKQNDVIAVNIHPVLQALNYYTDQNIIYFSSQTVERLLEQNKLTEAFKEFGVTKIIGFDPDLSQRITEQTGLNSLGLVK
ncbi:MAG: hypothetical protein ABH889_02345 [Candidatus Portnoybacteria bacterium]